MIVLNPEQRNCVEFLNGICSVIAVPGSGKTAVMMNRIGKLVTKHQIQPESILGLTFTRNAAEEMRSRLRLVLNDNAERVMLVTIHSFCHYLLRNEGFVFEILSGKAQFIFFKDIIRKLKFKNLQAGTVMREISLSKNNLIDAQEFRVMHEGEKTMQQYADVYDLYEKEKRRQMMLDFDDLLTETHKLLTENEAVREKYRLIYPHVLVDEWQDTNPVQLEIVKLLLGDNTDDSSLFVVGDDWQSIYAFTGATVGNILNFKEHFPEALEFILNVNYRSTPQILKACQNLIAHNIRKIEKVLHTDNPDGEDICVIESTTEEVEALNIVTEIRDLINRGYQYKDIAVLYRANFQSRIIEEMFSTRKVPYHIENGLNFYERSEVKVLLDYMRLIRSPDSEMGDDALKSVINKPNRYAGRKFIAELEDFAHDRNMHLYPALKIMPIDIVYVRHNMKDFIAFIDPLICDADNLPPCDLIQVLRSTLDYDRFVTEEDIPTPDDQKIANLNQLQLSAVKYKDIASFLQFTDNFQDNMSHDSEGVALMTIHKAKGLEFPVVFVVGLVEGILPSKRGDMEEERRICFVGISRAMKILYLSYTHHYLGAPVNRSVFIDEIQDLRSSIKAA